MALSSLPPKALSKEQFDKAIAEEKTTIEEIDPALFKWYSESINKIKYLILLIGGIVLIIAFAVAFLN